MDGLFYNLGRRVGRAAVPALRRTKWAWQSAAGDEDEVLKAEASFGKSLATQLLAATPPSGNREVRRKISEIGQAIQKALQDHRRTLRADVVQSDSANAMSLPGGFVFLSEQMVEFCGGQSDELAFVIGHEVAHVVRRHAWNRMVNQAATRVASLIALRAGPLAQWMRHTGLGLLQNAHSRDAEVEADLLGVRLAASAGYYPAGAVTLLRRLEAMEAGELDSLGKYFSSHPPASERLASVMPVCQQLQSG